MNLAIIGAGESSRIKAEGLKTSKHLIKINDEYLIDRIIRIAKNNDVKKVVCIINTNEPELEEYLNSKNFGIPLKLIVKNTISSMHSLFELSPYLKEEPFCLSTTDTVFVEKDFNRFINYSVNQKNIDGIISVTEFIDDEKPLCVEMNNENTIIKFSDTKEGFNLATGGIYYFLPTIFNEMQSALNQNITRLRNFFRLLNKNRYHLKGFLFSKIIDVDHLSDISKAEELLSNEKNN